jgi:hypothetical protein
MGARLAALTLAACGSAPAGDAGDACLADLALDCAPLYDPPAYTTIFEKILRPSCATGDGTCHTADAAAGGLTLDDVEGAYAQLVQGDRARVVPGDPACSRLVERLEAATASTRMPPGPTPLLEAERCTIIRWIAEGAAR